MPNRESLGTTTHCELRKRQQAEVCAATLTRLQRLVDLGWGASTHNSKPTVQSGDDDTLRERWQAEVCIVALNRCQRLMELCQGASAHTKLVRGAACKAKSLDVEDV